MQYGILDGDDGESAQELEERVMLANDSSGNTNRGVG